MPDAQGRTLTSVSSSSSKLQLVQVIEHTYLFFLAAIFWAVPLFWFFLRYDPFVELSLLLGTVFLLRYALEIIADEKLTDKQSLTLVILYQFCLLLPTLPLLLVSPLVLLVVGINDFALGAYYEAKKAFTSRWLGVIVAPLVIVVYFSFNQVIPLGYRLNPIAEFFALLFFVAPMSYIRGSISLSAAIDSETGETWKNKEDEINRIFSQNPPAPLHFDKTIPTFRIDQEYVFETMEKKLVDINANRVTERRLINSWSRLAQIQSECRTLLKKSRTFSSRLRQASMFFSELTYPRFVLRYRTELILRGYVGDLRKLPDREKRLTESDRLLGYWKEEINLRLFVFRRWLQLLVKLPDYYFLKSLCRQSRSWRRRLIDGNVREIMRERVRIAKEQYGTAFLFKIMMFEPAKKAIEVRLDWFSKLNELCGKVRPQERDR